MGYNGTIMADIEITYNIDGDTWVFLDRETNARLVFNKIDDVVAQVRFILELRAVSEIRLEHVI